MAEERHRNASAAGALGVLWRSLVTGLGFTLAIMTGGMAAQALGLPLPDVAGRVDPTQVLLTTFLAGLVIGLALGPLSARLALPTAQRAGLLFVLIFVLNSVVSVLEALFFTTIPAAEHLYGLVTSAVGDAGLASLLALLFRPPSVEQGLAMALREALSVRRWTSWVWRSGLAALLYLPIYFFFGMLIYPLVRTYYEDPALGLSLAVPGFGVILPLEVGRGLLFVLTAFPLIAVLRRSRRSLAFWLGMTITVLSGVTPMLQAGWFPPIMRMVHGLELTADSILHALVIVWLLAAPAGESARTSLSAARSWVSGGSVPSLTEGKYA